MTTNIGTADRVIRIIIALGFFGAGFYFKSWWGLVGFGPLLTAIVRFCPAYLPFGLKTCRDKSAGAEAGNAQPPAPPAQ